MRGQRYHGLRNAMLAAIAGMVALWWRWRPFRVAVEGTSMAPTLEPGDLLVAVRPKVLHAGTLVVVEHPERPGFELVKRLAAGPGDVVSGRTLGLEEWWVLGDEPGASTDSRDFGPVAAYSIRGEVRLRYWPLPRVAWFG